MATRSLLLVRRNRNARIWRRHVPPWIDPYPNIPGTEPEKRTFAALIQMGIFFTFQAQLPESKKGLFVQLLDPGFKPDFLLPEYKLIIDPFSPYHHSLPEAINRDSRKDATYRALGYSFWHPWAEDEGLFIFDQVSAPVYKQGAQPALTGRYQGALAMVGAIPILQKPPQFPKNLTKKQEVLKRTQGYELGPYLGAGANSVAAANHKRKKPQPIGLSAGTRGNTVRSRRLK